MMPTRTYRAGASVEDYCRACKTDRMHTIVVVDGQAQPLRVSCGYCNSEHNYRGGPRIDPSPGGGQGSSSTGTATRDADATMPDARGPVIPRRLAGSSGVPIPTVTDRERSAAPVMLPNQTEDLEVLLRRIIREEAGVSPAVPADKWRDGTLVLRPGTPGLQEKTWPIETFFHKVVMLRNRLRTLEQQVNASELPEDAKVKLQSYVTGCYGSLTSFNVLFADEDDQFKGSGE